MTNEFAVNYHSYFVELYNANISAVETARLYILTVSIAPLNEKYPLAYVSLPIVVLVTELTKLPEPKRRMSR